MRSKFCPVYNMYRIERAVEWNIPVPSKSQENMFLLLTSVNHALKPCSTNFTMKRIEVQKFVRDRLRLPP